MSLVENLVQQITSNSGLGAISKPQGFDMNDDTFAKLLEKTMKAEVPGENNQFGQLGMPAGFEIESLNGEDVEANNTLSKTNSVEDNQAIEFKETEPFEIKDVDMGDYFSNYLSNMNNYKSPVMNMAIKHASNAYNVFGKEIISDISDLASDLIKNM